MPIKSVKKWDWVCKSNGVTCGKYKVKEGIVIFPDSDLYCNIYTFKYLWGGLVICIQPIFILLCYAATQLNTVNYAYYANYTQLNIKQKQFINVYRSVTTCNNIVVKCHLWLVTLIWAHNKPNFGLYYLKYGPVIVFVLTGIAVSTINNMAAANILVAISTCR